jgi:hypothetical protein
MYKVKNEYGGIMKLDIKAFTLSTVIIVATFSLILFVWCSVNNFAFEVVNLFEKLHPSGALSISENIGNPFSKKIPGILINTAYATADSFIFAFLFSFLYNLFVSDPKQSKK